MRKRYLVVSVVFLLVISLIGPLSFGYKVSEKNSFTENYESYNQQEILSYNPNPLHESYSFDITESRKSNIVKEPFSPLNSPPIDSPWPMYCHDVRHTSRSPYSTANNSLYNKWWIKSGEYIEGSAAIDKDGVIYFSYADRDAHVYLYFAAAYPNGTLKWKCPIDGFIESSPAIAEDGTIYVGTEGIGCYFYAINPNGTIKWRYPISETYSSPVIANDGSIIFTDTDNWYIQSIYPNGTLKWTYKTDHVVYSSPTIGEDGTVYCGCHDTNLYALYPNGTLKWKYQTGHWIRASPCIGDDGTIYAVSLDNYLHAVNPNGTRKWATYVGAGTSPTIGQDGTIYAGYSTLYALNPSNGSVKWTFPVGGTMRGGTPCNSVDGTIFVGTSDGYSLIAINPNGTERWRTYIGTCEFAPIIGEDGTIYVGCSEMQEDYQGAYSSVGYLFAFNNMDPNAPITPEINGTYKGKKGVEYQYNFNATSPLGRELYYYVKWGDHDWTTQYWIGPYKSGETVVLNHTWADEDTYTIKIRCKDTENLWGPFSEYNVNTVPAVEIINPKKSYLHISGIPLFPKALNLLADAVSLGGFRLRPIQVSALGNEVWLYINNKNLGLGTWNPKTEYYEWRWTGWAFGKYTLRVVARDEYGAEDQAYMSVWNLCFIQ